MPNAGAAATEATPRPSAALDHPAPASHRTASAADGEQHDQPRRGRASGVRRVRRLSAAAAPARRRRPRGAPRSRRRSPTAVGGAAFVHGAQQERDRRARAVPSSAARRSAGTAPTCASCSGSPVVRRPAREVVGRAGRRTGARRGCGRAARPRAARCRTGGRSSGAWCGSSTTNTSGVPGGSDRDQPATLAGAGHVLVAEELGRVPPRQDRPDRDHRHRGDGQRARPPAPAAGRSPHATAAATPAAASTGSANANDRNRSPGSRPVATAATTPAAVTASHASSTGRSSRSLRSGARRRSARRTRRAARTRARRSRSQFDASRPGTGRAAAPQAVPPQERVLRGVGVRDRPGPDRGGGHQAGDPDARAAEQRPRDRRSSVPFAERRRSRGAGPPRTSQATARQHGDRHQEERARG